MTASPMLELDDIDIEDLDHLDFQEDDHDEDPDDDDETSSEAPDPAPQEPKKSARFSFDNIYPAGWDKNPATTYAEVHFTELLKGAALPGIRGKILHELLPLDLTHKVRQELGFTWLIDRPLPHFAPVQQIRTIIGHIRGFPILTGFEFFGSQASIANTIDLTIRLHGKERRMQVTRGAFKQLSASTDEWRTLMGVQTARRHGNINANARDFSMPSFN